MLTLPPGIVLRRLQASDSLEDLTDMLHRGYAPLAAAGMRFYASHQDVGSTRERCESGECWVLADGPRVVGTVTFYPPDRTSGTPHLDRDDVASFGQLCVDPEYQGRGLAAALMDHVEARAAASGAAHLALDTSEHAGRLIGTYSRRGFAFVEHCRWDSVNYRSVVMSKRIGAR